MFYYWNATDYTLHFKGWLIGNECKIKYGLIIKDRRVLRNGLFRLLCAQDGNSTLIEAMRIFLGGNVKVNSEDEVRPGEVQVHWKSHLRKITKCD